MKLKLRWITLIISLQWYSSFRSRGHLCECVLFMGKDGSVKKASGSRNPGCSMLTSSIIWMLFSPIPLTFTLLYGNSIP